MKYPAIQKFFDELESIKFIRFNIKINHIRSEDQTPLMHNHPYHYLSLILRGGYTEEKLINDDTVNVVKHGKFAVIFRNKNVFHRITSIIKPTTTLFISFGMTNKKNNNQCDGVYKRVVSSKKIWAKYKDGKWFVGNANKYKASREIRYSIFQK